MSIHEAVLDVETTVRCPVGNNKGHPHWPANKVIAIGQNLVEAHDTYEVAYDRTGITMKAQEDIVASIDKDFVLIGHNLSFDLQWLIRMGYTKGLHRLTLWDTALAEYVLSGQEHKMPSLNAVSVKYGLPVKDDKVKAFWDSGADTDAIPERLLKEYCEQDVRNTHEIYRRQLMEAHDKGVLKLILVLNGALLATTMMQWHGMKVDKGYLWDEETSHKTKLASIEEIIKMVRVRLDCFNVGSPAQVSTVFFGGTIKEETKEVIGKYKTGPRAGEDKYGKKVIEHEFKRLIDPALVKSEKGKSGHYSIDDEVLKNIVVKSTDPSAKYLAENILFYREVDKLLTTYITPILTLLFPEDYIYGNINSTVTHTGRYSSSNPNLQNMPSSSKVIKRAFISRFGSEGSIVEADFKQLELVALADMSRDPTLMDDVINKDIHTELYTATYGVAPTKEQRRDFKRAVFAAVYGAGPTRISELTGIKLIHAKAFLKAFVDRYPDVARFREETRAEVLRNRTLSEKRGPSGLPLGKSKIQTKTGRILTFTEYESSFKPGTTDFSWNDICNYPIQSYATGDLVPLFLDKLHRHIGGIPELADKCFLINTVHDSVVLDCHNAVIDLVKAAIKTVAANMPLYAKQELGIELSLPLNVEISHGPNWADQIEE